MTQRNTTGVDILVSRADATKAAAIQVKTNQSSSREWVLTSKAETLFAPRLFYVFVRLGTPSGLPEYFVVQSRDVANLVKTNHQKWLNTPGKKGQAHNESTLRKFAISADEHRND